MVGGLERRDLVVERAASLSVDEVTVKHPAAAVVWMVPRRPSMAVIDIDFGDDGLHGPAQVSEMLIHRIREAPVLVIGSDVTARDRVGRPSSGNGVFQNSPAGASEILERLEDLVAPRTNEEVTVLAFDDDSPEIGSARPSSRRRFQIGHRKWLTLSPGTAGGDLSGGAHPAGQYVLGERSRIVSRRPR